jgi:hypothetical protein
VWTGAENLDSIGIRSPDRQGERKDAYRVLVGTPEGKRPVGRPRNSFDDNIKMALLAVGWGACTGLIWLRIGRGGRLL